MDNNVTRCDLKFEFIGNLLFAPLMLKVYRLENLKMAHKLSTFFYIRGLKERLKANQNILSTCHKSA